MDRRKFVQGLLAGLVRTNSSFSALRRTSADWLRRPTEAFSLQGSAPAGGERLFPTDLKEGEWVQFPAAGFSQPACGLIRRHSNPATYGMPLGSIDTGCLAIETDGSFGLCSIFNSVCPYAWHLVQNMLLWIVPAAVLGQDLGQFCATGGMIDGMLRAANKT
jgi:hypothetical protein